MAFNGINSSSTRSTTAITTVMEQPNDTSWWHEWYTLRWGRYYGTFKPGRYLMPCDDLECDRLDIMNKFFSVARLYEEPIFAGIHTYRLPDQPKILDLGTGTGIWAIETADRHGGQGRVEGWDLNLTQPEAIPPNVSFSRRDIEENWTGVEPNSFDLIHMRMLNGSIENWPRLYHQVYNHLKPDSGFMEQVEIDWRPHSDADPRALADSSLEEWSQKLHRGYAQAGKKLEMDPNTKAILEDIGFTVEHKTIPVAFNPWPEQEHKKEAARWFNLGLNQGLEALTLEPLIHWLGRPEREVHELCERVKHDICVREWRTFCTLHIYIARRTLSSGRRA